MRMRIINSLITSQRALMKTGLIPWYLLGAALAEVANAEFGHWWITPSGDVAAVVLLVGGLILLELRRACS